ncbi:protein charlatan isoform X1 [Armigeres subalbatus]|uniref:protein charlatan isoform X1 n=1 Tax=Armigeres subalbatus TaxID=124917 RepID=UPI002ED456B5
MATLIPTSQPTGVEAYEDMFKEITRKLYGDESAHGLYPHNTQVAQVAQLASGAPAAPEGGERSFTTLVSDRNIAQIDYETTTVNVQQQQQQQQQQGGGVQQQGGNFKTEEHLTTAFGLAALMQNGFPPPGAILNPVHFPVGTALKPSTNIAIATTDDRWQQQTQQHTQPPQDQQQQSAGQEPSWASGGKQASTSTSYTPQKPFKKPKIEPQDGSPTGTVGTISTLNIPQTGNDKNKSNFGSTAVGAATGKRYSCTSCPYTTDRRDLFTRHENIHKEEKPFHCYACLKQFNRADHVKKHFLRMHRDMEYEIAKTRKSVSTKNNYYSPNAANSSVNNVAGTAPVSQSLVTQPTTIIQASNTLNIPTATFPTQITIPTHHNNQSTATTAIEHTITHDIATINGVVHHIQHQQQQQQQQQQHQQAPPPHQPTQIVLGPPIVTIKQEKGSTITTTTATTAAVATPTTMINNTQPHDIAGTGDDMANCDDKSLIKKVKGEKRFTCCYCPWSGADNWGLKRHLNTHTKPFVCMLCDYKAARSERLATHVFKVHNKKACNKCNYFAEDQDQLNTHMLESHPHDTSKPQQPKTTTVVISANPPTGGNVLNVGGITQNVPTVVAATTSSAAISTAGGGTGNVLRNLGNTFVTNNIPTGSISGNSFGTTANTNIYHTITTSASTGNILTNSNASNLIDTINAHLAQQTAVVATQNTVVVNSGNGIGGGVTQVVTNGPQHHLHQQQHQQAPQQQQQQTPSSQHQQSSLSQSQPQQQQQQQQTTHHWIAKVNRKRGAELLYSYLEADGSDSEDYARLLNMQAIGRNKASVTQDFHNAGGGNQQHSSNKHSSSTKGTNKLSLLVAASSSASCSPTGSPSPPSSSRSTPPAMGPATTAPSDCYTASQKQLHHSGGGGGGKLPIANGMAMANLTEEHLSLLQLLATAAVAQQHLQQQQQQQQQLQLQQKATSTSISTSPPAHHPHQQLQNHHHHQHSTNNVTSDPANNNGSKQRRRKSSSRNDKENLVKRHPTATAAVISGGKVIDLTTSISNGTLTGPAEHGIERNNNHNGSSNNNNSSVNNKNINEAIFDRVYKKPYNLILTNAFCKPAPIVADKENAPTKDENFSLSEFLRNHKEVSISTLADVRHASQPHKLADDDEVVFIKEEKRLGRKQQKPQRNQAPDSELNASPPPPTTPSGGTPDGQQIGDVIRDKHMIRLITRKLCCRICQNQQRLEHMDNCHYHSKTSLILHNRWRHDTWSKTERCHLCRASFNRKYKLILHQRLKHTNRKSSSLSAVKTKSKTKKAPEKKSVANKKQRKRKSNKSRSGAKSSIGKRLK